MKITFISGKTFVPLFIVCTIIFIAWGDTILPKPLNNYSRNTRHKLEQVLIGVFPAFDAQSKRPSREREKVLKKLE